MVIWQIDLDVPASDEACLDLSERRRAASFRSDLHRRRFTAAHVAVRHLLGLHAGIPPHALPLHTGAHGKPELPSSVGLHFSLAHSEALAVLALTRDGPVGIDVERVRSLETRRQATHDPDSGELALADRHFSQSEIRELRTMTSGEVRMRSFFSGWTRKEAWVKAAGVGLRTDLRRIETGLSGSRQVGDYFIQPVDLHPAWIDRGFVASLATSAALTGTRVEMYAAPRAPVAVR